MTRSEAYKILEVSENSSEEEIKAAYKKLAKKYHPDFYQNNPLASLAEEKLKEINEAYDILNKNKTVNRQTVKNSYDNNETKSQKVVLYWQGYSWELEDEIVKYNIFRKEVESMMTVNLNMYEARYKAYYSFDEFVSKDKRLFMSDIERVFSVLVDVCIKNDYDMFSEKILTKNYFDRVAEEYLYYYNECLDFVNAIDTNRRNEKEWKKTKDFYRGKTSLFDKAIRGVSNMYDEMGDNQKKKEMYSNPELLRLFKEAYKNAMLECMNVIFELLKIKINYKPNEIMSDSILENINRYPKDKRAEKLLQALTYNPYDRRIYFEILNNFGDINNELSRIAIFFGQNIEGLKKDKIDIYIVEFNDLKEKDISLAIKNFKDKVYLLGKKAENYINFQEEIRKVKEQKMNAYIAEFKKSVLYDENLAINTLKEKAKELELNLEEYIDLKDVINFEKNKKAEEYVAIFRTEVKQNKNRAERELKEGMNKLGLKLENFIDLDKEYKNLAKYKKNKKYILITLTLVIFGFLIYNKFSNYMFSGSIDSIPRVTNKKVLNLSKTVYLDSENDINLKKIAGNDYISYSTFDPNDKNDIYAEIYGKEIAYFVSFVEDYKKLTEDERMYAFSYVLSCFRNGKLQIEVYSDKFLAFAIPDLEKPQEIFDVVYVTEDEKKYIPVDLENLSSENKKQLKTIKKALKKFKEVSEKTSLNLGL